MLTILCGDALTKLRELPDESVQCCVTSPPYWSLRDYGTTGQLGLEKTPEEYAAKMVEVFLEVRRVLRKDGTLWLNLGDSYAQQRGGHSEGSHDGAVGRGDAPNNGSVTPPPGFKPKDMVGIPWMVAFALRSDGWYLRQDIIWAKPNPMPESVTDRCTKAHEYLFLLTKSARYFYDGEAIKERGIWADDPRKDEGRLTYDGKRQGGNGEGQEAFVSIQQNRNKRSVWTVATAPYPDAHFATYPPDLIKPCIMAGTSAKGCCSKCGAPWERIVERKVVSVSDSPRYSGVSIRNDADDGRTERSTKTIGWEPTCGCTTPLGGEFLIDPCTVLDPFAGSGTTGMVALELGRKTILIELNPKYVELIEQRCDVTPGLALA